MPITIKKLPCGQASLQLCVPGSPPCSIKMQARIATHDYIPMPVLRRPSKYSVQERAILNSHKDHYKQQTTPAGRMHVAQTDILPAIFNYWSSQGVEFTDGEIERRTKVTQKLPVRGAVGPDRPCRNSLLGYATLGGGPKYRRSHGLSRSRKLRSCGKQRMSWCGPKLQPYWGWTRRTPTLHIGLQNV